MLKKNLILFFIFSYSLIAANSSVKEKLTIVYWNDFHAQNTPMQTVKKTADKLKDTVVEIGGAATLLGYINKIRTEHNSILVLNAGDDFQGTPISTITKGASQIELMNMIRPNAVKLGNHEFDYGLANLHAVIQKAKYPVICSNIVWSKTEKPFVQSCKIVTIKKLKIGIFGLMAPDLALLTMKKNIDGIKVTDIRKTTKKYIDSLHSLEADIIILLSHMGIELDTTLAKEFPAIDIIVGGHSHTQLLYPIKKNNTIVVQAGSRGAFLGKLDIDIDVQGDSILNFSGKLIETLSQNIHPDSNIAQKVAAMEIEVNAALGEVIGTLETNWERRAGKNESNIGNWEADVIRKVCRTDIAFINAGGIRKDLRAGPITLRDIWEINPFGNTLQTFSVHGDTLKKMMLWQANIPPREFLIPSGISYFYNSESNGEEQNIIMKMNEKDIDVNAVYSISTNNYVASHLYDFFGVQDENITIAETGIIDRDAFIEEIRSQKNISSRIEGRVRDKKDE